MLHDRTLLNHRSHYIYIYMQPSSFDMAMSYALNKVGKSRMALKDEHLMAIQHVYTARMCLYGTDRYGKYSCMSLTICICASHPFWRSRSSISPSRTCKLRFYMVWQAPGNEARLWLAMTKPRLLWGSPFCSVLVSACIGVLSILCV